jgi:hypothetical protein
MLGAMASTRIVPLMALCWALTVGAHEACAGVVTTVATFPITFSSSGRIEIRAKLLGYEAANPIPYSGAYPFLFGSPDGSDFRIVFVGNDGAGGGGLSGTVNGGPFTAFSAATGSYTAPYTYGEILGNQSSVDAWHTYDLVWNTAGLTNAGLATGHTVAVYLDGQLNSTYFRDDFGQFSGGSGVLDIGTPEGYAGFTTGLVFDDLRIWNGDNLVLANDFENRQLVSTVGPNGTYIAGSFVPGYSGNGLSTNVPEPCTLVLLCTGLVAFGAIGRRKLIT